MGEVDRIRVVTVDDHEVLRGGIKFLLLAYDDVEVVGEARSGEEALRICEALRPDVVLMDLRMPEMDGVATTRSIRERCSQVQVIMLSTFCRDEEVQRAMKAGAIGYLLKDASPEELVEAIRAAHAGRPALAAEAVQALVRLADPPPTIGADLSPREREVLALLADGLSNAAIAERLVISTATVKYHVRHVLAKLEAGSRTEAIFLARQHNLVS